MDRIPSFNNDAVDENVRQLQELHSQRIRASLRAEEKAAWDREADRSESLLEWAVEQGLSEDPKRIPKLYAEARRRWAYLTTRHGISQILEATLRRFQKNEDTGV